MLLKGLEALQLPPMAESSVLSLSPRGTAGNTEAFLQTLCTQLVLSQRKAEHGFHTQQLWDLAVRNGQFLKSISMGTASRHQERLARLRKKEPLVTCGCAIITLLFVPCPGLPPQLAPHSSSGHRRRVLAQFYPTMPCHRPDQSSHVTWSHLWQDLSVSKYCISRARTNSPSVA